jgi:predicted nucleic acid-binding protein
LVLIDSSVWIGYFNQGEPFALDELISNNLISTNSLVLSELIPVLRVQNKVKLINLLKSIYRWELNISWQEITDFQIKLLRNGISEVGIPDLIIAQNSIQNNIPVYSLDKHFSKMTSILGLEVYAGS